MVAFKLSIKEEALIVLAIILVFIVSRAPQVYYDRALNPDEALTMAQAMRYELDMTPWKSVDGSTGGPLNSWFLVGAHKIGFDYGYRSIHLLAALSLAMALTASWYAVRRLVCPLSALGALALVVCWFVMTPHPEFSHFASEIVSTILISLSFVLLATCDFSGGIKTIIQLVTGGSLLGFVPWAKLQAGPIAFALGLWAVVFVVVRTRGGLRSFSTWGNLFVLCVAAVVPSIFILGWLVWAGSLDYAIKSYIGANLAYAFSKTPMKQVRDALILLSQPIFSCLVVLFLASIVALRRNPFKGLPSGMVLLCLVLAISSVYTLIKPYTQYLHYQILVVVPVMVVAAVFLKPMLEYLLQARGGATSSVPHGRVGIVLLTVCTGALFFPKALESYLDLSRQLRDPSPTQQEQVINYVQPYIVGRRSISVWGWAPYLYVKFGFAPPSRHAINPFVLGDHVATEMMRSSYMADMVHSNPELIIDVDDDMSRWGVSCFPKAKPFLAYEAYLSEHYHMIASTNYETHPGMPVKIRIYERSNFFK